MYSRDTAERQPQYSRCTAAIQPLYSRDTAERQPQYNRCTAEIQPKDNGDTAARQLQNDRNTPEKLNESDSIPPKRKVPVNCYCFHKTCHEYVQ